MKLDVDEQLAKLLENQKLAKKVEREYTEEERRIKQQILSQYSQVSENWNLFAYMLRLGMLQFASGPIWVEVNCNLFDSGSVQFNN